MLLPIRGNEDLFPCPFTSFLSFIPLQVLPFFVFFVCMHIHTIHCERLYPVLYIVGVMPIMFLLAVH